MRPLTTLILTASLATGVLAVTNITVALSLEPAFLQCLAPYATIVLSYPKITHPKLASIMDSFSFSHRATHLTNPCAVATVIPSSLSAEAVDFQSRAAEYVSANAEAVSKGAELCAPFHMTIVGKYAFDPAGDFNAVTEYARPGCFRTTVGTRIVMPTPVPTPVPGETGEVVLAMPTSAGAGGAVLDGFLAAVGML
ncbi:hypothetical protein F5Y04DRAFT_274899 [Hypomontagnella monticulosa]|nr:hypothetical protein F5Y04DRAFT_274899 [Hypomontagnella monticulosa]